MRELLARLLGFPRPAPPPADPDRYIRIYRRMTAELEQLRRAA